MDFYRFVNSPDIRKHLRTIRYRFSSSQAAWLVWQSRNAALEEKHRAWQTIISTMPDGIMETELDETPTGLREYLMKYMNVQNELVEGLHRSAPNITAEYRPDSTLLSVGEIRPTKARSILCDGFETTCFKFPVPFRKGDILHDPGSGRGPFVLHETGDFPQGYFLNEDSGELYSDSMFLYMNCEYYRGALGGKRRVLTVLSSFVKGKTDICRFSSAYHQILSKVAGKDCQ